MYQRLVCLLNFGCNATDFRGYETQPGIFCPPPPPSVQASSGSSFSPALAGIIVVLAFAFIAVSYYTIFVKCCAFGESPGRRRRRLASTDGVFPTDAAVPMLSHGLDEAVIRAIPVCKYIKGDGLVEITDCSVCLSEFQENDSLRLLPKCSHAFHLLCIDEWLQSHSTCPLCRANVISTVTDVPEPATSPPVLDPILQDLSLLQQENYVHDLQALAENNLPGTSEEHKQENLIFDEEGPELLKREDRVASNHLDGQSYTRSFSVGCASKIQKQLFLSLKRSFSVRSSSRNIVVDFVTEPERIQDTTAICTSERQTESSIQEPGCACEDLEECSFPVEMEIPLVESSSTQMRKSNLKSKSFHDSMNLPSKAYALSRGKVLSLKRSFSAGRIFSFIRSRGRTAIRADINRTPI